MKILFVTTTLPRFPFDSQSSFVWEQITAWKQKRPQDQISVLAPGDRKALGYEVIDDIEVYRFSYFWPKRFQALAYPAIFPNLKQKPWLIFQLPFLFLAEAISIRKLVQEKPVDLLYAHWVVPNGLASLLALSVVEGLVQIKPKLVVQNHSADLRLLVKIPLIGKHLAKQLISRSERFFCVNSQLRDEALKLFKDLEKEMAREKIAVLPMGVKNSKCKSQNAKLKAQGNPYKFDLGFIGRFSEKKGIRQFLEAAVKLNMPLNIGLAGDGELKKEIEEEAKKCKIQNANLKINFLGYLKDVDIEKFFQQTKILVFPSLVLKNDIEGLPVSLLEALINGKPVIASKGTNVHLLPEWEKIKNTVFLLTDPTNQTEFVKILLQVLSSEPLVLERDCLQRYHWQNLIVEYITQIKL